MPLQDLTPQLRTRLSRMERAVGWFVLLATALLLFGFGYYVYHTAQRKGWFVTKAPYFTYVDRATGLKVGDPVKLMGFEVGQITRITAEDPGTPYNVYVEFEVKTPFYGYIWTDGSRARVTAADFLGKRELEVTKGTGGCATYVFNPLLEVSLDEIGRLPSPEKWTLAEDIYDPKEPEILLNAQKAMLRPEVVAQLKALGHTRVRVLNTQERRNAMTAVWNSREGRYEHFDRTNMFWMRAEEAPAVTEQLERLVAQVEKALPSFFTLTNQIALALNSVSDLTSNLNSVAVDARPAASNLTTLSTQLLGQGALGAWLFSTAGQADLEGSLAGARGALTNANMVLTNVDASLTLLTAGLARSLDNLAGITSNLNQQVQVNTNLLKSVSDAVVHADDLLQGLKRHWLLRSAFKTKATNAPPAAPTAPVRSPKNTTTR
ncbi:MAG TPA: MlaD family protein [Verrucomicrobiae bacterium]